MTAEQFIADFWWIGLIIVVVIAAGIFIARKRKGKIKSIGCKHKFEYRGCLVINKNGKDFPRQIQYCPRCKSCIHLPIKTLKEQAEE
jgi:hypothetical protein